MADALTIVWQSLVSAGGLATVGQVVRAIYLSRSDRRGTDATSGKTTTEAVTNLSSATIQLLSSAPAEIERLGKRLAEADERVQYLEARVRELDQALRLRTQETDALKAEMDQLNIQLTAARMELAALRRESSG